MICSDSFAEGGASFGICISCFEKGFSKACIGGCVSFG